MSPIDQLKDTFQEFNLLIEELNETQDVLSVYKKLNRCIIRMQSDLRLVCLEKGFDGV